MKRALKTPTPPFQPRLSFKLPKRKSLKPSLSSALKGLLEKIMNCGPKNSRKNGTMDQNPKTWVIATQPSDLLEKNVFILLRRNLKLFEAFILRPYRGWKGSLTPKSTLQLLLHEALC